MHHYMYVFAWFIETLTGVDLRERSGELDGLPRNYLVNIMFGHAVFRRLIETHSMSCVLR